MHESHFPASIPAPILPRYDTLNNLAITRNNLVFNIMKQIKYECKMYL